MLMKGDCLAWSTRKYTSLSYEQSTPGWKKSFCFTNPDDLSPQLIWISKVYCT
jgi:hypothetical protein